MITIMYSQFHTVTFGFPYHLSVWQIWLMTTFHSAVSQLEVNSIRGNASDDVRGSCDSYSMETAVGGIYDSNIDCFCDMFKRLRQQWIRQALTSQYES